MDNKTHYSELCVICLDESPSHFFIPCMHQCICENCAIGYCSKINLKKSCPVCREMYTSITSSDVFLTRKQAEEMRQEAREYAKQRTRPVREYFTWFNENEAEDNNRGLVDAMPLNVIETPTPKESAEATARNTISDQSAVAPRRSLNNTSPLAAATGSTEAAVNTSLSTRFRETVRISDETETSSSARPPRAARRSSIPVLIRVTAKPAAESVTSSTARSVEANGNTSISSRSEGFTTPSTKTMNSNCPRLARATGRSSMHVGIRVAAKPAAESVAPSTARSVEADVNNSISSRSEGSANPSMKTMISNCTRPARAAGRSSNPIWIRVGAKPATETTTSNAARSAEVDVNVSISSRFVESSPSVKKLILRPIQPVRVAGTSLIPAPNRMTARPSNTAFSSSARPKEGAVTPSSAARFGKDARPSANSTTSISTRTKETGVTRSIPTRFVTVSRPSVTLNAAEQASATASASSADRSGIAPRRSLQMTISITANPL